MTEPTSDENERRKGPRRSLDFTDSNLLTILIIILGWLCGGTWYVATEHAARVNDTMAIADLRATSTSVTHDISELMRNMATVSAKVDSIHEDVSDIKANMHHVGR